MAGHRTSVRGERASVVVLLGPPGSGKSTLGRRLGLQGLRWRDWESVILQRWGSRERFIANKAEALPLLHQEILQWIASEHTPAVLETTGLSDAPLLSTVEHDFRSLVVRLDVSETEGLRRVQERAPGHHLSDATEPNRAVWSAYRHRVLPRPVDLVIDTEGRSVDASIDVILRHLDASVPPPRP